MNWLDSRPACCGGPAQRLRSACGTLSLAASCGTAIVVVAMAVTVAQAQQPLPSGLAVANGQATAVVRGNQMTVTNSSNAILNWQSFSVGNGNSVRFDQPSASSQVLNRVVGNDPSSVLGSISSNGGVWLVNPNGVLFGPNARLDVAGFVASTLNINDADWRARRYSLYAGPGADAAAVTNLGELRSTSGGRVMLFSGRGGVRNEGVLDAPGGQVGMASAQRVELVDSTSPFVAVRVTVPEGAVLNLGRISAAGGQVDLNAAMVNQQGVLSADGAGPVRGGNVRLQASESLNLASGSITSAGGSTGGAITAQGGTALISGIVTADGLEGTGGKIQLLGTQVGLMNGAVVSASGRDGGGEVLVGGGQQGRDPNVPNATATYLAPTATLSADATQTGNGGRIIVWSDDATRAYAHLSARGGATGGNGGLIETSGGWLDARPSGLALDAPRGRAGNWLLDPYNIIISNQPADVDVASTPPTYAPAASGSTISVQTINNALQTGNVTITTLGAAGNEEGNIITRRENGPFVISGDQPNTLELIAAGTINMGRIEIRSLPPAGGSGLNVTLRARRFVEISNTIISTPGAVVVEAQSFVARAATSLVGGIVKVNADFVTLGGGSSISAIQASGTTISLGGGSGRNIRRLSIEPGATLQVAPSAAWEIFVPSIESSASFGLGDVIPDRYVYLPPSSPPPLAVGRTVFYSNGSPTVNNSVSRVESAPSRRDADALRVPIASMDFLGNVTPTFGPVDVSGLPAEELSRLLDARDAYKGKLLGPVLNVLSQTPSLAEVPDCKSFLQATVGDCLNRPDFRGGRLV